MQTITPIKKHLYANDLVVYAATIYSDIYWDPTNNWVYNVWKGYQSLKTVQAGGADMIKLLKEKKAYRILNDNRLLTGTWTSAAEWNSNVWFPEALKAGLKHLGWVVSPDVFDQFPGNITMESMDDINCLVRFKRIGNAIAWLKQQ